MRNEGWDFTFISVSLFSMDPPLKICAQSDRSDLVCFLREREPVERFITKPQHELAFLSQNAGPANDAISENFHCVTIKSGPNNLRLFTLFSCLIIEVANVRGACSDIQTQTRRGQEPGTRHLGLNKTFGFSSLCWTSAFLTSAPRNAMTPPWLHWFWWNSEWRFSFLLILSDRSFLTE